MRLSVAAALVEADEASLGRFLAATRRMGLSPEDEVVVGVTPAPGVSRDELLARSGGEHERILVLDAPQSLTLLWGRAMAATRGTHVAVLDARDEPAPGWVAAWAAAPRNAIVCGPVAPVALTNRTSWAAYLSEYGQFHPPVTASSLEEIPGNNVVFPRELLPPADDLAERGFWKTFHLERLRRSLPDLAILPLDALAVSFQREYRFGYYLSRRFTHGRCYGGSRLSEPGAPPRLVCLAFTPVLPALRTWRVLRRIAAKPTLLRRSAEAVLPLLLGEVTWAAGEAVGYARGAGDACAALR